MSERRYVPGVGEWVPELDGFLMEYLRFPKGEEKESDVWVPNLVRALQVLNGVDLPFIQRIADDRPHAGMAIGERFRELFEVVLQPDDFWSCLPVVDTPKLQRVREYFPTYVDLLSQMAANPVHPRMALAHGDLAGDNIMLSRDGRLTITDWSTARISAALTDAASLSIYSDWPENKRRRSERACRRRHNAGIIARLI